MRVPTRSDVNDDEETPLLHVQGEDAILKSTPLPAAQISVLILPWIAETIVSHSMSPYINQVGLTDRAFVAYETGIDIHSSSLGISRSWVGMDGRWDITRES
jgi:hypothetical protein